MQTMELSGTLMILFSMIKLGQSVILSLTPKIGGQALIRRYETGLHRH